MPQATPLPNTLGDTVARCQALLGDPGGYWCSRAYAVPFIQSAYSDMAKRIKNGSGKNFEAIVELLNVPLGTQSLYNYQSYQYVDPSQNPPGPATRGPLAGLFDPIRLWVKIAGALPQWYTPARGPRDTPRHVNPPGVQAGNFGVVIEWSWIGNKLFVTPVQQAIDIQVYGRFNPPRLVGDDDKLLLYEDMTDTLAFAASAIMGVERANPSILQGYETLAISGIDNIVADVIRQTQREPRRLAKMGGHGGTYYGWGNGGW